MVKKRLMLFSLLLAVCLMMEVALPVASVNFAVAEDEKEHSSDNDSENEDQVSTENSDKSAEKLTMYVNGIVDVNLPGDYENAKWKSSNKKVVAIVAASDGKHAAFIAKKEGKATVTAKCEAGTKKWHITVKSAVSTIPSDTIKINIGETKTIEITDHIGHLYSKGIKFMIASKSIINGKFSIDRTKKYKLIISGEKAGETTIKIFNKARWKSEVTLKVVVSGNASPTNTPTATPVSSADSTPSTGVNYRALVIGNGTGYYHLNRLFAITKDVQGMNGALNSLNQNWQVTTKENLTVAEMKSAISSAFADATANDICLFFYSGHGDDRTGSTAGALCGIECDENGEGLFTPAELQDCLNAATPGKVIVAIDACGSGATVKDKTSAKRFTSALINALKGSTIQEVDSKTGELRNVNKFAVLVACEYGTTSQDAYVTQDSINSYIRRNGSTSVTLSGNAFTYALVKTMGCAFPSGSYNGSMAADMNNDGQLTLKETYDGVSSTVRMMDKLWREFVQQYLNGDSRYLEDFAHETRCFGTDSVVLFSR